MKLQLSLVLSFLFCISASFSQTCIPAGMATPGQECTYATAGSYTYTIPVGVEAIKIEAWGGGASGGFDSGDSKARGGGGYVENTYSVTPGQSIEFTVGLGGVISSASSSPGEDGGDSFYNYNSLGIVTAGGGSANGSSGGSGGTISGSFDVGKAGGDGGNRLNPNTRGGGGGGSGLSSTNASGQTAGTPNGGSGGNENNNGGEGTTPGGGGQGNTPNPNSAVLPGFGGDGQILITITDMLNMPVELSYFEAKLVDQSVLLNWTTTAEIDNDKFEIQRSSDGHTFQTLGEVNGHGTSIEVQDYTFEDPFPVTGQNYYRLKQIDFDGQYAYSPLEVVEVTSRVSRASIFPNPANDQLFINTSNFQRQLTLSVFDINGRFYSRKIWEKLSFRPSISLTSGLDFTP